MISIVDSCGDEEIVADVNDKRCRRKHDGVHHDFRRETCRRMLTTAGDASKHKRTQRKFQDYFSEKLGDYSSAKNKPGTGDCRWKPGFRTRAHKKTKARHFRDGPMRCRRRPTLPRPLGRSTIGAVGLNDRVRNGNGCGPYALVASEDQLSKIESWG